MTRAKRARPTPDATSVVGSERDNAVLASLAWARFLSTGQIARLHFPSRRTAQRRLRALLDHGLVRAHLQGEALQRDNVFTLTPVGLQRLVDAGLVSEGVRLGRVPRFQKLAHGLAIRDVFVVYVLAEKAGQLRIVDFRFEEDLCREPVFQAARLVPDALVVVEVDGQQRVTGIEVDLGTETTATLRAKLDAWLALLAAATFDQAALLFVVTSDARRVSIRRLAQEGGIGERVVVVLAGELSTWIAAGYSHATFARVVRAVRMEEGEEGADFRLLVSGTQSASPVLL